jgi:hypothetical protein
MDVTERYLGAIRRNLPRDKAEDIVAELRDVIASHVEDREATLGRRLDDAAIKDLLKAFGHPLVVAARYRRQQWLIGPDVYPFYITVVRIVATIIVAALAVGAMANIVFNGHDVMPTMLGLLASLWTSALVSLGIVTLIFVLLERRGFPADHMRRWDPSHLPDVKDAQPGPWEAAIEVALSAAFLLWWSGLIHLPYPTGGRGFRMEAAPIFAELYWPIFAVAASRLVHNLIEWLRPRWTRVRVVLAALTTIGGLALLAILYRAGSWAVIVPTGMAPAEAAQLQASVNLALRIAILVAAIVWAFQGLQAVYRLFRNRRLDPMPA